MRKARFLDFDREERKDNVDECVNVFGCREQKGKEKRWWYGMVKKKV